MTAIRPFARSPTQPRPPGRATRCAIRNRGGDAQLDLSAAANRIADLELPLHNGRALAHPGQTEMAVDVLPGQRLRVNPLPIVADRQPQLPRLVVNRDRDMTCTGVPDRI